MKASSGKINSDNEIKQKEIKQELESEVEPESENEESGEDEFQVEESECQIKSCGLPEKQ